MTLKRLKVVLELCERALDNKVSGDIVEFGCYIGSTSLFLRRVLGKIDHAKTRALHVYDSFAGLPEKRQQDASPVGSNFKSGELFVSKKQLLREFQKAQLEPPIVHKGWFSDLRPEEVPPHIAFAFLDGDFYQSIIDSLRIVWDKMSPHAIIAIDDYGREALPGVERAVDEFLRGKAVRLHAAHNVGILELP